MKELQNWYLGQSLSSKILLALMVLMMLVFMLFEFAIDPWKANLKTLRSQVNDKASTVVWMEEQYKKNKVLILNFTKKQTNRSSNVNNGSLITRIEQSAKKQKIYSSIERITPDKVGRVKVWINNGDFRKWVGWVETLKAQNINVVNARINQTTKQGPVSINVTFQNN